MKLAEAAHNQSFIGEAPVVIVCCTEISDYIEGSVSGIQDLGKIGAVDERIVKIICKNIDETKEMDITEFGPRIAANVAIAIEHIVLRALDFNLGTYWIRAMKENKIRDIFDWNENTYPIALLPVRYPDEFPKARKRLEIKEILLD